MARLADCYNIEDLRAEARRRLPKGLFEFIDRATEDDIAMRRNRESLDGIRLVPRAMVDVSRRSTDVEFFGRTHSMPLAISPAGPAGYFWFMGELALARAAAAARVPFTLSTYSTTDMEEIARTGATLWFQLYLWKDRSLSYALVDRVRALGFEALVVTIDTAVLGQREYLKRNGFSPPFSARPKALLDMLLHPRWLASVPLRYATGPGMPKLVNLQPPRTSPRASPQEDASFRARTALSQSTTWDDLARLREMWPGTLMVKGILRVSDAERAVALGADAVVVSNHGGRNLDCAVSPVDVLAGIAQAVSGKAGVFMDSGVRRGSDIVKSMALGATGVFVGRPVLYGIAAAGESGALHAIDLLKSELDRTMALAGCCSPDDIAADLVFDRDFARLQCSASDNAAR